MNVDINYVPLQFLITVNGWLVLWCLVWGIAVLYTIMTISIWTASLRTLGLSSLRHCIRMLRLSSRASAIRELFIVILAPVVVLLIGKIYGPAGRYIEMFPIRAFLVMSFLCFTLLLVPPTILVFSTSTNERLRWALALKAFAGGRRVISLLDTGYMTLKPSVSDVWEIVSRRGLVLTDVLRTSEASDWQAVVKELIGLTPIVVIDTRVYTRALHFEAATMLAPHNAHKAIFVSENDGSCPVLEQLAAERAFPRDSRVSIVKEDELGQMLRRLVTSRQTLLKSNRIAATPYLVRTRAFKTVRPDSDAAGSDKLKGSKRLSVKLTPLFRFMAKAFVVHIFASLILGFVVISQESEVTRLGLSRTAWSLLVLTSCGSAALFYGLAHSLKEVYLLGDHLLVSDYAKQSRIDLSQVSHVTGPDWTTLRRITLHLRSPCVFGKRIVFAAGPFKGGLIARELRRWVYSQGLSTPRVQ